MEGGNKLLPLLMAVVCTKCHIAFWHSLSLALSEAMIAGEVIQNSGPCEWPLNFMTAHKRSEVWNGSPSDGRLRSSERERNCRSHRDLGVTRLAS